MNTITLLTLAKEWLKVAKGDPHHALRAYRNHMHKQGAETHPHVEHCIKRYGEEKRGGSLAQGQGRTPAVRHALRMAAVEIRPHYAD